MLFYATMSTPPTRVRSTTSCTSFAWEPGLLGVVLAKDLVSAILDARSTGEERHRRRLNKVAAIEKHASQGQAGPTGGGAK